VSDIKSTVNNIKKKVNVLPNEPVIRNLSKKVDPAVVGQLIEIVGDTKDVLDSIQAKREGFDGCKNGDAADQMRRDLKNIFEDLRVLADTSHPTRYVGHGDRREDPHPTAACGATERIDLEDPLQEIGPGRAAERGKGASDERLESSSCVERHRAGFNRFSG
jgi:hypothetical protein